MSPMVIPTPCRPPVAMTKPTLYSNPLWPSGSSVPWAWPWKIAKNPTITAAAQRGGPPSASTNDPRTNMGVGGRRPDQHDRDGRQPGEQPRVVSSQGVAKQSGVPPIPPFAKGEKKE